MTFPVVDSHQHIWDPSKANYSWLGPHLEPINRVFEFEELLPELQGLGIDFTIQVQSADNSEDTDLMRSCASKNKQVIGIVGYAPLQNPKELQSTLDSWKHDPLMVGVRNLIHNQQNPKWLLDEQVLEGLAILADEQYPFDVVAVLPDHLAAVLEISEKLPNLRMVIDHLAKPPIGLGDDAEWRAMMRDVASNPLTFAKVSGLYSATADLSKWSTELVRPFFDFAMETFGANRLMYGGDWPISLLAGGYSRVWNGLLPLFNSLNEADRDAILGRNALAFYRISSIPELNIPSN